MKTKKENCHLDPSCICFFLLYQKQFHLFSREKKRRVILSQKNKVCYFGFIEKKTHRKPEKCFTPAKEKRMNF